MSETAHRWFVHFSQVMTSYQENTTKQPIECWILTTDRAETHRHTDKRRNWFLKRKRVKHFFSNLNNNANETSASWYDVTHDDDFRRIAILKRSLNLFLAFCGIIYQNLLHRWVYIAVSSSKPLFRQFSEKPLHITFKALKVRVIWNTKVTACTGNAVEEMTVIVINAKSTTTTTTTIITTGIDYGRPMEQNIIFSSSGFFLSSIFFFFLA